ncbi:MAG: hypothetical protein QNJ18_06460 [Xenococcaceae cyanobacterium MO_167.B52]|nr:hypothetical protein [Xenococcaceae cyanobacterium MO_167.B52]
MNRGFFSNQEQHILIETFKELTQEKSLKEQEILDKAEQNNQLNKNKKEIENNINECNQKILEKFQIYIQKKPKITKKTKKLCDQIINLVEISEHNYRLEQVRHYIEQKILKLLKT